MRLMDWPAPAQISDPNPSFIPPLSVAFSAPLMVRQAKGAGMDTLAPFVRRFVRERERRGEIAQISARNFESRLDGLVASFGKRPLSQFGPRAINRWQETIGDLSPATRHAYTATARVFCRWLVKEHLVRVDAGLEIPRVRQPRSVPRALPAADVARLLAVLPDERARAIVWLLVGLGLRRGEVSKLEVGDYDPVARTMFVHGKGGHERVVPTPKTVMGALDQYLTQVGAAGGPLIRSRSIPTAPLSPGAIGYLVSMWMRDAGVKHRSRDGVSAHALRHTTASDVMDRSGDLRLVQNLLGHANVSSTSIYLRRASLGQLREAMEGRPYNDED